MLRRRGKQKFQYKASRAPTKKTEAIAVGQKRKQSESSGDINNISINISLGNDFQELLGGVNPSDSQSPAKKAETGPS
ncbi:hypothetical protein HO173_011092 [Letharia columbiana]|uniref:Uncharacterized protein n=1 Tax=Letharia columbiana TaxID=112416 RepID=A0A8H6FLH9_9LECA|nr:uncharacterized protein HO173_011092 [Letharia columbiana]KAF6230740.1 hypothetical protein HO173_011092 [Letharia columbiana]